MNRWVAPAAIGAVAALAFVAVGAGGYAVGNSHAAGRVVTVRATVTKTTPAKIVTRWKTNTKTVTVTVTASPTADGAALAAANACISDLYQMIGNWLTLAGSSPASWTGGNAYIPHGWWEGPPCPPNG